MSEFPLDVIARRGDSIRRGLARHRLVFVQLGRAFSPLRDSIIAQIAAEHVPLTQFLTMDGAGSQGSTLVITSLEGLVSPSGELRGLHIGSLRERVMERIDAGQNVCLISSAPRIAFGSTPGSSVLDDCALVTIDLLNTEEIPIDAKAVPGAALPIIALEQATDIGVHFQDMLVELGPAVLAALDHALFEVDPRGVAGLRFLQAREVEALRGSGLVVVADGDGPVLTVRNRLSQLRTALACLLSAGSSSSPELAGVTSGLWYIERTVRATVRRRAIDRWGQRWRGLVVPGDLAAEVLKRARGDTNPAAASIRELRDPLEWLTLGELLDIVRSAEFAGLGVDPVLWRRFSEQLVPVRNRLSHMRHLKNGDEETVIMWVGIIRQQLDSLS